MLYIKYIQPSSHLGESPFKLGQMTTDLLLAVVLAVCVFCIESVRWRCRESLCAKEDGGPDHGERDSGAGAGGSPGQRLRC